MQKIKSYLKLMRPHHYIKNILIFLPIIFSQNIFNVGLLVKAVIGAVAFSLMTSIVYIINDIMDVDADRKHEKKKFRPIAADDVTIREAIVLGVILYSISMSLNLYIHAGVEAYLIFNGYLIMNILYSIKLKHIPIIDVLILGFGFLFRVLYGSAITGIVISNWLYLTILSFSFYMGLGKRRNEFKKSGAKSRKVLEYYNESFLNHNMYMFATLGIVFYSLWCIDISAATSALINIIWTVPFVIAICMKYSLDVEGESLGDPVDVILSDKILMIMTLLYALIMFVAIYY